MEMGTGKSDRKLRIVPVDYSAVIITDSLGITYPMWDPSNIHCPSRSLFFKSWGKTSTCVLSTLTTIFYG